MNTTPRKLRVALAHDWLVGLRGGEWVLDRLAAIIDADHEHAGMYTMFDDGRPLTPRLDRLPRTRARLGGIPAVSTRARRWLLPLYPWAVAELSRRLGADHRRRRIDLVISTSSAAIKGLRPPPGVPHLCYIHTPARYLWTLGGEYRRGSRLRALGLWLFTPALRRWDASSAAHVTAFLANSTHTADLVRTCYGREARVVFPPVRTDFFTPGPGPEATRRSGAWLVVAALEPYKRVDVAIDAARLRREPLVVIGDGSQRRALERRAGPDVEFRGRVSDGALRDALRGARGLLFPQIEDFGIAAAEALACGTRVIAFRAGGALDILGDADPPSGVFFTEPTPDALAAAMEHAGRMNPPDPGILHARAQRFSPEAFERGIRAAIAGLFPNNP